MNPNEGILAQVADSIKGKILLQTLNLNPLGHLRSSYANTYPVGEKIQSDPQAVKPIQIIKIFLSSKKTIISQKLPRFLSNDGLIMLHFYDETRFFAMNEIWWAEFSDFQQKCQKNKYC